MFISHSSVKFYVVGHQMSRHICDGCSEHTEHVFRAVVKKTIMLLDFGTVVCMRGSRGGGGGQGVQTLHPPPEKSQNIGFFKQYWSRSHDNYKLPSQHSMLGRHRHASETPLKWRFAGRPMMAHF